MELLHKDLTDKIIKIYYQVYNELGYGFRENVYEKAMLWELQQAGLKVERQRTIGVYYKEMLMGEYIADLIVDDKVILELKAKSEIVEAHEAQLLHYLRATTIEVGLLINFGTAATFRRKVYANTRKKLPR